MVAGTASCSCAQCGAVCEGLYPGCVTVWAAGPRNIALTRPPKTSGSLALSPTVPPSVGGSGAMSAHPDAGVENPELRALRIEVQRLATKVDQLRQEAQSGGQVVQAAKMIGAVAASLPRDVRGRGGLRPRGPAPGIPPDVRGDAGHDLERHRPSARRVALGGAGPIRPTGHLRPRGDGDGSRRPLPMAGVDEVSQRFVILGNNLARIERDLMAAPAMDESAHHAGSNGAGAHGGSATNGSVGTKSVSGSSAA